MITDDYIMSLMNDENDDLNVTPFSRQSSGRYMVKTSSPIYTRFPAVCTSDILGHHKTITKFSFVAMF